MDDAAIATQVRAALADVPLAAGVNNQEQLRRAAQIAHAKDSAIAIGHPRPTTLAAVRALLPQLQREGISLVLAADLVR